MFKPQLALHLHIEADKKKPKFTGRQYAVFQKYDGIYGYFDDREEVPVIRSRQGRVIPAVQHLANELALTAPNGKVLIFEILVTGVKDFHIANGILNRQAQCPNAYIICHDLVDPNDLSEPFRLRYAHLDTWFSRAASRVYDSPIRRAPWYEWTDNPEHWRAHAEAQWERGNEGVILKAADAGYSPGKRNADLLKIKCEVTLDLVVTGVEPGAGKYAHTLGALIVQDKNGREHRVSGMSDSDRDTWWGRPYKIIGQVVEVQAMAVLPDGGLREPRFKAVRHDKSPAEID